MIIVNENQKSYNNSTHKYNTVGSYVAAYVGTPK